VEDPVEATAESKIAPLVWLFVVTRLVINTAYRMVYPFLRAFAAGAGVPLEVALIPLSVRSLAGIFGPLLAPVADRFGRKAGMLLGLGFYICGVGLVAAWPAFPAFLLGLMLAHLGNQVFLPAMQAFLGDLIPYRRRGRVLALTELSWSLSFMLLVPPMGWLIAHLGWSAPFWVLAGLGMLVFFWLAWRVPGDPVVPAGRPPTLWHSLRRVLTAPAALVALSFGLLITVANEVVNAVFGVWMGDAFGLDIAALGLAATVIWLAELSGEGATAALVDRIGKKRAVGLGLALTSLASLALPWLGQSLEGGFAGLFLFYLGFEFTLVSFIPVMTEVMPQSRATLMAANLAALSLGRALGAPVGLWLYGIGFRANALTALALNGLALLVLTRVRVEE
jgi:predicted MFS family arabinose efflux permease